MSGPTSAVAPPADPIGDALRADMVAYWKLDETSGTRIDSTGNGHNLSATTDLAYPVSYGTGKFSNGLLTDDTYPGALVRVNDSSFDTNNHPITCWFWVKFDRVDLVIDQTVIGRNGPAQIGGYPFEYYVAFASANNGFYLDLVGTQTNEIGFVTNTTPIVSGVWYFVYFEVNRASNILRLAVNNNEASDSFYDLVELPPIGEVNTFSIGGEVAPSEPTTAGNAVYGITDEVGFIGRALTSGEKTYLYNGGAGRSLY